MFLVAHLRFPAHSETDLNNVTKVTLAARRKAHADDLADFLQHIGTLPRFHAAVTTGDNVSPEEELAARSGFNSEGPRLGCYGKHKAFRTDMGVTLKGAGGDGSYEAESVADALVDAGICDVRSLCRLVLHDELGGLGEQQCGVKGVLEREPRIGLQTRRSGRIAGAAVVDRLQVVKVEDGLVRGRHRGRRTPGRLLVPRDAEVGQRGGVPERWRVRAGAGG